MDDVLFAGIHSVSPIHDQDPEEMATASGILPGMPVCLCLRVDHGVEAPAGW